jgi:micrococcal nuclease
MPGIYKTIAFLFLSFCSLSLFAQKEIKLDDASKSVGDSVRVCGKVFSSRFFANAQDAPTLLNLGAAYPNQLITVVIYSNNRNLFSEAPEIYFKDKEICVSGKIVLYKEKPQIVIYNKEQIMVLNKK